MSLRYSSPAEFFKDNLPKVFITVGIVLVIFGIFTSSAFGTIFSTSGLFAGSLLVIFGFLSQVGLLSVEWRSINGVGTVFLCVIVCFFVLAAVSLVFQEVSYVRTARAVFHGNFLPCSVAYVHTNLRFVYLFATGIQLGLVFLVSSLVLKAYHFFTR